MKMISKACLSLLVCLISLGTLKPSQNQKRRPTRKSSTQHNRRGKRGHPQPRAAATVKSPTDPFIFFWHENNNRIIDEGCLSQWHQSDFMIYNITFCNAEQFMMYCKARYFDDCQTANAVLDETSPKKIKDLGKLVSPFDPQEWSRVASCFVEIANSAKFSQNAQLKKYLLSTGDKILVEASPYDRIWGIGLSANDPRSMDPRQWQGKNQLGNVLMKVRGTLQKGATHDHKNPFNGANNFSALMEAVKNN